MTIRGIPLGALLIAVIAVLAAVVVVWFNVGLAIAILLIGLGATVMIAQKTKKG